MRTARILRSWSPSSKSYSFNESKDFEKWDGLGTPLPRQDDLSPATASGGKAEEETTESGDILSARKVEKKLTVKIYFPKVRLSRHLWYAYLTVCQVRTCVM